MYYIDFFENGIFSTRVGGAIGTLSEALLQMKKLAAGTGFEEMKECIGIKWLRAGTTPCCMVVRNDWGQVIKDAE